MVITDIKKTKIRLESKMKAREILTLIDVMHGVFAANYELLISSDFLFVDRNFAISRSDDLDHFKSSNKKEIWFYNGEFHDKPQNYLINKIERELDESHIKASEKLIELGYEYHNGEWLSKDDEYHDFEWENGDKCIYKNNRGIDYTYIGSHPSKNGHFVFNEWKGIEYIHNDYIERVFSIGELKLQIEKNDMKIGEFVSVLSYLVSVSQENEEKLCELLNDSGNYGESEALCKARLLLAKHNKGE